MSRNLDHLPNELMAIQRPLFFQLSLEGLRGRADSFTFNRLSLVGEGASPALAVREEFEHFLRDYTDAARSNPVIGRKGVR
jgi:hypothetical protein